METTCGNEKKEKKNYCIKCGVSTEDDRSHCPICGKCVNEENIGKSRAFDFYPRYTKWKKDRRFLMLLMTAILALTNIIWFGFEFGFSGALETYWYYLAGSVVIFILVIWPLVKPFNYLTKSAVGVTAISGLLIFIDALSHYRLGAAADTEFGWSVCVAVPMVLMGYAIAVGLMMLYRGYYGRSAVYPNLYIAVLATVIFGLNLGLFVGNYGVIWASIVILAVSWGIFAFIFIVRYKKIISGIKKDFHI